MTSGICFSCFVFFYLFCVVFHVEFGFWGCFLGCVGGCGFGLGLFSVVFYVVGVIVVFPVVLPAGQIGSRRHGISVRFLFGGSGSVTGVGLFAGSFGGWWMGWRL
jgi:hypothetical protein